jgi:hypothetical protein
MQRLLWRLPPFHASPLLHVPLFAPGAQAPALHPSFEVASCIEEAERSGPSLRDPTGPSQRTMMEN